MHNYYIYIIGFLEDCVKEENVIKIGVTTSCLKRRLYNVSFNITYSPSRQTGVPVNTSHGSRFVQKCFTRSIIL